MKKIELKEKKKSACGHPYKQEKDQTKVSRGRQGEGGTSPLLGLPKSETDGLLKNVDTT